MDLKKIFCLIVIIGISGNIALADIIESRLHWSDICPAGLENAQYKEIRWYWPEGTKDTQELYNFWAKRREDFEESLAKCNFMIDDFKRACYENLKASHLNDTANYDNIVRLKNLNKQNLNNTQRMSKPIMINVIPF